MEGEGQLREGQLWALGKAAASGGTGAADPPAPTPPGGGTSAPGWASRPCPSWQLAAAATGKHPFPFLTHR